MKLEYRCDRKIMIKIRSLMFFVIPVLFFTSCVKESLPECCPDQNGDGQLSVTLHVKDKNYTNVTDVGLEAVDENLPLNEYISNYYYILQDINTGVYTASGLFSVFGNHDEGIQFMIDNLPEGEYEIAALADIPEDANRTVGAIVLHRKGAEDSDLYLAIDTVLIAARESKNVSMDLTRLKGKLCVIFSNLPDEITKINTQVTSISQSRNAADYSGTTTVSKVFMRDPDQLKASDQSEQFDTFLAPSVEGSVSMLNLSLYSDGSDMPMHVIEPIEISINKNEITAVKLDYDDLSGDFAISVYIDYEWVVIKTLDIIPL